MKVVKVCPECKKYNNYKLYECAFCGANLGDDTREVNDDEEELVYQDDIEKVKEEEVTLTSLIKENEKDNNDAYLCPVCGYTSTSKWCDNCGNLLTEDDKQVVTNSEVQEEKPVSSLTFTLTFKGKKFSFEADSSLKSLGRHDFDSLNDENLVSVSRAHLEYYLKDGKLYIKDISSYGTKLNGISLEKGKEYLVNNHDQLTLVYITMEIEF